MQRSGRFEKRSAFGLGPLGVLLICWVLDIGINVTAAPSPMFVGDMLRQGATAHSLGKGAEIGHDIGTGQSCSKIWLEIILIRLDQTTADSMNSTCPCTIQV